MALLSTPGALEMEQIHLQMLLGLEGDASFLALAKTAAPTDAIAGSTAMPSHCNLTGNSSASPLGFQQLLLQHYLQQRQQQAAMQATEQQSHALAAHLLSIAQSSNTVQVPANWQLQQQQRAANHVFSQGGLAEQQHTGMHPACSQAPFSSTFSTATWQQQQQQYPTTSVPGPSLHSSSSSMGMSATQAQLQLLLHGCQLPMGSFLEASQQPLAVHNTAAYGVADVSSTAATAASAAAAAAALNALNCQQQQRCSSQQLDRLSLEPYLLSSNLEDVSPAVGPGSSSSDISSSSRQCSLERRTSSSYSNSSSGGNSPQSKAPSWGLNLNLSSSRSSLISQYSPAAAAAVDDDDIDDPPGLWCNHLCKQELTPGLDAAVTVLLNALRTLQYGGEHSTPQHPQRMYVCGLRESCKAIRTGRAKAVLLAPDIQLQNKFGKPDRVLNGRMNEVIQSSIKPLNGGAPVPVVFALSRKKIGQVFGSKKRMSAIALLDVRGVEDVFGLVLQLAQEGRQRWNEGCMGSMGIQL